MNENLNNQPVGNNPYLNQTPLKQPHTTVSCLREYRRSRSFNLSRISLLFIQAMGHI